jgi:hypothetical protein
MASHEAPFCDGVDFKVNGDVPKRAHTDRQIRLQRWKNVRDLDEYFKNHRITFHRDRLREPNHVSLNKGLEIGPLYKLYAKCGNAVHEGILLVRSKGQRR